ncbi:ATP-dependent zinc metalloprotease FtsH [bacterium]|nr:ATP-dependent zinc metalloprotease FtsH [bacterium]
MNETAKNILLWIVIAIVLMLVFNNFGPNIARGPTTMEYSEFIGNVKHGRIQKVTFAEENRKILVEAVDRKKFLVINPENLNTGPLMTELLNSNVTIDAELPKEKSMIMEIFISWFPMLLLIGVWIFFMRQMAPGGKGQLNFGKSKAKLLGEDKVKVTFADVAGCDEAKEEVTEIVEFLRDPAQFTKLGGKAPRGILMIGSPGTGKTLLARAIAGEAKVPFFTISGSDFVEMFVGVGASRVRDMFEQAKKNAPCIVFIDEIDAVGRHRGSGFGGGHDEREQTLNQLLVEMDGFEGNEGITIIAATNRPDVLDPALLRPGRFDRQVVIPLPDILGRDQILKVHIKKILCAEDVKTMQIARGTPGFSGADLANLVNEAALMSARAKKTKVDLGALEKAKDKILMGVERKTMVISDEEKKITAYHEAGHCIVGRSIPCHDPVYKVSIIPRGRALGVTMFLPERDPLSMSREKLEAQIASLYGGRIAEELIFGEAKVTTGASNDIERATKLVQGMVLDWGLSPPNPDGKKEAPRKFAAEEGDALFLKGLGKSRQTLSPRTEQELEDKMKYILNTQFRRAMEILEEDDMKKLHAMAEALIKYETIGEQQISQVMEGRPVTAPERWTEDQAKEAAEALEEEERAKNPPPPAPEADGALKGIVVARKDGKKPAKFEA